MSVFIAMAALLTLLVVAWFVRPLLWPASQAGVSSQRLNASIYRDQLQALERDLARGVISADDFETTQDELQLRLLDDTAPSEAAPQTFKTSFLTARRTAWLIAVTMPLASAGAYWWMGTPQAIDPVSSQRAEEDKITKMVDGFAERLKANPDNPKGWAMLARSYKALGRLPEAEQAYAMAGKLVDTDPDLLADYADLIAARNGNSLEGQPLVLINKALALNPLHPMSLMLAGNAAYRQGDYAGAVKHWENLLPVLDPNSPDVEQLQADIADARAKAGMTPLAGGAVKMTDQAAAGQKPSPEQILQMVNNLATRQAVNPGDLAGWARLARAYKVLGRLPEAATAYAKAGKVVDADPDMLTDYADVLASQANNNLEGRPLQLINKALVLNPLHPKGLMLAGSAALMRGDYAGAVATWEKLLPVLQPGSKDAEWLTASIAEARTKGGLGLSALGKK